jgi:hypothetical protein
MKKRKGMGRPPKPKAERRSKRLELRLSGAEYEEFEKRAKAEGLTVSEYLRRRAKGE